MTKATEDEKNRARKTIKMIRMIIWHAFHGNINAVEDCVEELRNVTRKRPQEEQ